MFNNNGGVLNIITLSVLMIVSLSEASYQYGAVLGTSPYGNFKSRVEQARSSHWGPREVRALSEGSSGSKSSVESVSDRRALQAVNGGGYLVADQFSSPTCDAESLEYSAVYKLGSCVPNAASGSSYMYSDYIPISTGLQVTYTSYADSTCTSVVQSKAVPFSGGCTDGAVYSYVSLMQNLPAGVMFAQYYNASKCSPSGPDFYFATIVPLMTCYGGYEFTGCAANSYTYCHDPSCPLPGPTANPTLQPSALPTAKPTYMVCPCGAYLNAAGTGCSLCASGLYNPGIGAISSGACVACPANTFVSANQCECISTPSPSAHPTLYPSTLPTENPTRSPIAVPTRSPISLPTLHPTGSPIAVPTQHPTIEVICGCGQYLSYGACVSCGEGSYSPGYGAVSSATCAVCPKGFFASGDKCSCVSTPAPSMKPTSFAPTPIPSRVPSPLPTTNPTDIPFECPCGSYAASVGAGCSPCPVGSYMPHTGAIGGCFICPVGYTSPQYSCSCYIAPTPEPTAYPTDKPIAQPTTKPSKMPIGTPTEIPTTNPVPQPTKMPIGTPTEMPTTAMPTHSACGCGHYLNGPFTDPDAVCTPCPAGTYSPGDAGCDVQNCATCPEGFTSEPGACICNAPPSAFPTFTNKPSAHPTLKPVANPTDKPIAAPTDFPTKLPTRIPTAAPTNQICPCGTFFEGGQCIECGPNTRTISSGATSINQCVPCAAGFETNWNDKCSCIPVPTAAPTPLPPTRHPSALPTHEPTFQICPCGSYLSISGDVGTCKLCGVNTFNPSVGRESSSACQVCHSGFESDVGACACSPVPTALPTLAPTRHPSALPTAEPTWSPIPNPTRHPTAAPTVEPTWRPVANPTIGPTHAPCGCGYYLNLDTATPSCVPCGANSYNAYGGSTHPSACVQCPKGMYSGSGACNCLAYPTAEPTLEPTRHPSALPTIEPTFFPTNKPIAEPTYIPTAEPTFSPTNKPISEPTYIPTAEPTLYPTALPSAVPTHGACGCGTFLNGKISDPNAACDSCSAYGSNYYQPAVGCVGQSCCKVCPKGQISIQNGCSCQGIPTAEPTQEPTRHPSALPTAEPTFFPTPVPTRHPSALPTAEPTLSCPCGHYVFGSSCKMCKAGTYNPSSTTSDSSDVCTLCAPGFTSTDGQCSCVHNPTSIPTAAPTFFPTAAPVVKICPCGSFTDMTTNSCVLCSEGYYSASGALGGCLICEEGFISGKGACLCYPRPTAVPTAFPTLEPTRHPSALPTAEPSNAPIPHPTHFPTAHPTVEPTRFPIARPTFEPTFKPTAMPTPVPCKCGSFDNGQGVCTECGPGTYMPDSGNCEGCYACPPGYTSDAGACSCFVAATPAPTKNPVARPTSEPSQYPTAKPTAKPTALPTPVPSKLPTTLPSFYPTAEPTRQPTKLPTPDPTRPPIAFPTAFPTVFPTHAPCPCGTYLDNNNCALCPANTFSPGVGALCVETCAQCDEGSFSSPGSCRCETTVAPTQGPSHPPTPAPSYKNCPCGYFLDLSDDSCVQCSVGTYAPLPGMTGCYVCGEGMTSTLGSCTCHPAPPSAKPTLVPSPYPVSEPTPVPIAHPTEKPIPAPTREPIAQPTHFPTAVPTTKLCICECGFYWSEEVGACIPCASGSYNPIKGAMSEDSCIGCPAGATSGAGSCVCSFTSAPTLAPVTPPSKAPVAAPSHLPTQAPVTQICACGSYLDITSNTCLHCSAGTFSPIPGETSALACVPCPGGFTSPSGACGCSHIPTAEPTRSPTRAPVAFPTPLPSYAECPCGSYREGSSCIPCDANYFSPGSGAISINTCAPCPAGSTSGVGSCQCTFPGPTGIPVARPTSPPVVLKTAAPSRAPVVAPTAFPSTQLQCSEIPYTGCTYEDGFYMSTSCTLQVTLVYEAASTPEIEVLTGTSEDALSAYGPSVVIIAGASLLIAGVAFYVTSQAKKNSQIINQTSQASTYVKVSSQEEVPFAMAPLKLGGHKQSYGDHHNQL